MLQAVCRSRRTCWSLPAMLQQLAGPSTSASYSSSPQDKHSETVDFGYKEVPRDMKSSLVGQVFSSVAQSYDVMNDLMSAGMHRLWKDTLVERLRPFAGMKHLDVAGGTGDVAFRVLRAIRQAEAEERLRRGGGSARPRGAASSAPASSSPPQSQQHQQQQPGSLTVLDINPQMLEVGKQKAAQQPELAREGAGGGLAFVVGDAEKLPFADDTFDGYTIAFGIRNVTDRDAALREARRVLRPGGHFLCLEFSHVQQAGLREIYDAYSFHVIPKIGGAVANDEASYRYLVESIRKFPDQEAFARMIETAGMRGVTYENMLGGVVAIHSGFKL